MARVKAGPAQHARKRKTLKAAKGYYGRKKSCFRVAVQAVEAGMQYAYRDRRNKKRDFRGLWIQRINAAARIHGITYSQFTHGLKLAGIDLDRKILADIAVHDADGFKAIFTSVKSALDTYDAERAKAA